MRGVLVLLAFCVLLAGCTQGGGPAAIGSDKPPATVGVDDPSKGKVTGIVSTLEEELPIEGANVALFKDIENALVAVTDAAGTFTFLGVEPGRYAMTVTKIGYTDFQDGAVEVVAGETVEKSVPLKLLPSMDPWHETWGIDGVSSGWGYKTPFSGFNNYPLTFPAGMNTGSKTMETHDVPEALQNVVGELQWVNNQITAGNLYFIVSHIKGYSHPDQHFVSVEGPSPIHGVADAAKVQSILAKNVEDCTPGGKKCRMDVNVFPGTGNTNMDVDAAVALQQRYALRVTTFYHMDASQEFTALG